MKVTLKRILLSLLWIVLILLSAYFYYDNAITYFFGYRNERFADHSFWFIAHILGATCSLFLGPVQFWKSIRINLVKFHRIAGKIYVIGTLIAAVSAFRLAFVFVPEAIRFSLIPLSILLFMTTAMAWYAIKNRNIKAHQQFMVRSYTLALAFVFVRLYQILPLDSIFGIIEAPNVRGVVYEWMFSFLPLIVAEIFISWIPSLKLSRPLSNS